VTDAGTLLVAATPIGNPGDASARLRSAIATTPVIAAEDTRRFRRLAADLDVEVPGRVLSLFEGNEAARSDQVLAMLRAGTDVLLVSDAGMPGISDPGARLVVACRRSGIAVDVLPGPSAVSTALVSSGLPTDRFVFEGFIPRKGREREQRLAEWRTEPRTIVFFESPRRLAGTLQELAEALGDRDAAVCRELTKTHQEVRTGSLDELATWAQGGVLGEIVVVLAGASQSVAPADLVEEVARLVAAGSSRRDAVASLAAEHGISRRDLYNRVLAADSQA